MPSWVRGRPGSPQLADGRSPAELARADQQRLLRLVMATIRRCWRCAASAGTGRSGTGARQFPPTPPSLCPGCGIRFASEAIYSASSYKLSVAPRRVTGPPDSTAARGKPSSRHPAGARARIYVQQTPTSHNWPDGTLASHGESGCSTKSASACRWRRWRRKGRGVEVIPSPNAISPHGLGRLDHEHRRRGLAGAALRVTVVVGEGCQAVARCATVKAQTMACKGRTHRGA